MLELLTANYTFLNEKLVKHYGIPNVTGSHFRKVMLPPGSPRAGLLGQGSVLAPTWYATRTSVVLRGKYVLQNLLNTPPPAPPPNVPALKTESGSGQALSMRKRCCNIVPTPLAPDATPKWTRSVSLSKISTLWAAGAIRTAANPSM